MVLVSLVLSPGFSTQVCCQGQGLGEYLAHWSAVGGSTQHKSAVGGTQHTGVL